ncbi:hypothetical protein DL770_005461 [Monosporascus sp. CRB-9-2]|nr:hypothetical protein DL770_005461 [Monosporascus sp. CRB-9-2]
MLHLPPEIYDAITILVERPRHFDNRYALRHEETYDGRSARKRLSILRLVNRPFCQSASIRLFRCIRATISGSSVSTDRWPLARLRELCTSPSCAPLVRRLEVGYHYFDHPGPDEWKPGSRYQLYAEDAARLLPVCLAALPNLEALDVRGPSFPSLNLGPAGSAGSTAHPISSLVEVPMRMFTDAVVSALRYIPLPRLVELNLRLAVTHEFGAFFPEHTTPCHIPVGDVMRRLRHLEISISDFTERDSRVTVRSDASLSALAGVHPNPDSAALPLRLVELAATSGNLELLSIRGSDMLNLDALRLGDGVSLRHLVLTRVSASAESMLHILEQSRYSLRGVRLTQVELNAGTWRDVLAALATFPLLCYFSVDSGGYSRSGASGHLVAPLPVTGGGSYIRSLEQADHDTLAALQRHAIRNRKGAGLLPYQRRDPYSYYAAEMENNSSTQDEPNLLGLPAEVRLVIYYFVFQGSRIEYDPSRRPPFRATRHWTVLATCKQIYDEGRKEYWRETRVHMGPRSGIADLAARLPDFVRDGVRHIRRLDVSSPSAARETPGCLARFAGLRTCELLVGPSIRLAFDICEEVDGGPDFPRESVQAGVLMADTRRFLERRRLLRLDNGCGQVAFLVQFNTTWKDHRPLFPPDPAHPETLCFVNLSTERFRCLSWRDREEFKRDYRYRGTEDRIWFEEEQFADLAEWRKSMAEAAE